MERLGWTKESQSLLHSLELYHKYLRFLPTTSPALSSAGLVMKSTESSASPASRVPIFQLELLALVMNDFTNQSSHFRRTGVFTAYLGVRTVRVRTLVVVPRERTGTTSQQPVVSPIQKIPSRVDAHQKLKSAFPRRLKSQLKTLLSPSLRRSSLRSDPRS